MNVQGAILRSCLGPLARYGTHQETMSGRLEQVYLLSDSRLDLPGEGPLFELDFNKWWGGNVGTIQVTPWAINYVRPRPLVRYGTGVNHYQMWLNIVIKLLKYCIYKPARRLNVHCLSFCVCHKDDQRYSNVCNVKKYLFIKSLRVYFSSHR